MFGVRCYIWRSISGTCFWKGDQHISNCKRSFAGEGWKILFTRCSACFYSAFFATSICYDICVSTIMYLSILCEYIWIRFRFILFFGVEKNCFLSYLDFMNVDTLTRTTGFLWRFVILNGKFSGSVGNRRTRYCLFDNRFRQLIDKCKPNNA